MANNSALLDSICNDGLVTRRNIYELAALHVVNDMAYAYNAENDCDMEAITILLETFFDELIHNDDCEVSCNISANLVELFGTDDGMTMHHVMMALASAVIEKDADTIEIAGLHINNGKINFNA